MRAGLYAVPRSIRQLWAPCCHTHIIPHVKAPPSLSPLFIRAKYTPVSSPAKAVWRVFCRSEQDPEILLFGIATVAGHADGSIWKVEVLYDHPGGSTEQSLRALRSVVKRA
jgi:hypothetical protein